MREDEKTLDKRLFNNESSAGAGAGAGAHGRAFNWNSEKAQNERPIDAEKPQVDAQSVSPVEMDCHDLWEYETGFKLTGSIAYELERLEQKHGRKKFHQALKDAVAGNSKGRVTFNYFKAILEGGRPNGKNQQRSAVTVVPRITPPKPTISKEEGDAIYAEILRLDAEKRRKRGEIV